MTQALAGSLYLWNIWNGRFPSQVFSQVAKTRINRHVAMMQALAGVMLFKKREMSVSRPLPDAMMQALAGLMYFWNGRFPFHVFLHVAKAIINRY